MYDYKKWFKFTELKMAKANKIGKAEEFIADYRHGAQDSGIPEIPGIVMGFFFTQGIPEIPGNVMGFFH